MKKIVILVCGLVYLPLSSANDMASTSNFSVGAGAQYGGFIGVRYHIQQDIHVFSGSLGLIGGALGYQYILDEDQRHLIGGHIGGFDALTSFDSSSEFAGITYEFYARGFHNKGWQIGLSGGISRSNKTERIENKGIFGGYNKVVGKKTGPAAMISIGYKF